MTALRQVRLGVALATGALVTACAGVPDSGGIHLGAPVADAGQSRPGGVVYEVPALPAPGATPIELVGGFLRAMVDSDNGYAVARSYLGPGVSWSANTRITVYRDPPLIRRIDAQHVRVRAHETGVILADGSYRVASGRLTRTFAVSHRGGEWRITGLAPGALLSTDDVEQVLQPASVYFLTPDGERVVPEPLLEPPDEPGLATTLIRALLAGPNALLAPGVRTAAPHGTSLVGNVPISADGVADVDLSAGVRQIAPADLVRLSAQIVWTLRQIPSVTAVRLLATGASLSTSQAPSLQPIRSWPQFDPSAPPATPGALVAHDGAVSGLGAVVPEALRARGLSDPARSADGTLVAALRHHGRQLVTGDAAGPLLPRLRSASLTAPCFLPDGQALVGTAAGAVYAVTGNGTVRSVHLPASLAGLPIRALAASRDGTRLALVVGAASPELQVATLARRHARETVTEPRVVLPASSDAAGVAWASADQLVTTTVGAANAGRRVVEVSVDGYTVVDLSAPGLPADVHSVAAAPGRPVLASGAAGTWRLSGPRWVKVSAAVSPSYAG
ncbi:MAG TPA: LpqB family beta-propeller domain-containing protein [Mycobacteriales bacterium]|nr:LpqB family beta-propeller domain-containing protein [Mycobacteriales bacterium]